jgi:hypothetical protein
MVKVFSTKFSDTIAVFYIDYFVCDFDLTKCNKTLITFIHLN